MLVYMPLFLSIFLVMDQCTLILSCCSLTSFDLSSIFSTSSSFLSESRLLSLDVSDNAIHRPFSNSSEEENVSAFVCVLRSLRVKSLSLARASLSHEFLVRLFDSSPCPLLETLESLDISSLSLTRIEGGYHGVCGRIMFFFIIYFVPIYVNIRGKR